MIVTYQGGLFDIQSIAANLLASIKISTTRIFGELHLIFSQRSDDHPLNPHAALCIKPGTNLFDSERGPRRENPDISIREFSAPRSALDHAAYLHDVKYYNADAIGDSTQTLETKHEADQELIKAAENFKPKNWTD